MSTYYKLKLLPKVGASAVAEIYSSTLITNTVGKGINRVNCDFIFLSLKNSEKVYLCPIVLETAVILYGFIDPS